MERTQWCIRVPIRNGEAKRLALREAGLLDPSLRPRAEGAFLLHPVTGPLEGEEQAEFPVLPEIPALPRHEQIGGIAVMQDHDRDGAELLLASRPSLHTVLLPESDVEGEHRTRRFEVLAGEKTTRTRYVEHGLRFSIDLSAAYFSPRLSAERRRLLALTREGERVLDMFTGVGPAAITLAQKAGFVAAADINPAAILLLLENLALNRTGNVLPILGDARSLPGILPGKFDRVVMNLPMEAVRFLPGAVSLCRAGGVIHLYALQEREAQLLPEIEAFPVARVQERVVRSYSPGSWHAVYDITLAG